MSGSGVAKRASITLPRTATMVRLVEGRSVVIKSLPWTSWQTTDELYSEAGASVPA